jgi:hypothetical protein
MMRGECGPKHEAAVEPPRDTPYQESFLLHLLFLFLFLISWYILITYMT